MGDGDNKVAATKDTTPYNTLSTTMVRLPIGHSARDTSNTAATLFHLLVPTNAGGDLSFVSTGTGTVEMTLYAHDGTTKLAGPSSIGSLSHHLGPSTAKAATHGTYYLLVKGPSPREVSCKFRQTGVARNGTSDKDPPLIPWNFHFWPSAQTFTDGTTNPAIAKMETVLRNYAKAFNHNGDEAVKFEASHHQPAIGEKWVGHCHFIARASILFERPVDTSVAVPGKPSEKVSFTEEELWFLAGEWFGGWATRQFEYTYKDGYPPFESQQFRDEDGKPVTVAGALPDRFLGDFLKPSELDLPEAQLIDRIKAAIVAYDPSLQPRAQKLAQVLANMGRAQIKMLFGQRAAFFYSALVENLHVRKEPLVGDMRGEEAGNTAPEVWNHAVFLFEASFKEILPLDEAGKPDPSSLKNQDFMEISLTTVANEDYGQLPSASKEAVKPPALTEPDGSVNVSSGNVENRKSRHVLHIAFDASSGDIKIPTQVEAEAQKLGDDRHRWLKCRAGADDIYIPRTLAKVLPVATKVPPATRTAASKPTEMGNKFVELDAAAPPSPILKIRKRYLR